MISLLGIKPLVWKVIGEARGFLDKIEGIRNQYQEPNDKSRNKLRAHVARSIWNGKQTQSPGHSKSGSAGRDDKGRSQNGYTG